MSREDNELYHHGIKGQQWGVRHGPPYPLDGTGDITIKKGTRFRRLSIHDENAAKGHAYVNYLKGDVRHYRGFFGARLKAMNKGADVYSIELEAKKDLRAPSKNKRVETFVKLYKDDPILRKELGKYYKEDWHNFTPLPRIFYEMKFSNLRVDDLEDLGYKTFVRSVGGNDYIRNRYFNELAKQGYSFVTDDMDAGRFGKEPSIIFDRTTSTSYIGQTPISTKEMLSILKAEGAYMKDAKKSPAYGNNRRNRRNR